MSDCLFCKIVSGDIPATILRQTDRTVAFRDIKPQAPIHVLVVPRDHYENVALLAEHDPETMAAVIQECTAVADDQGLAEGYRIVFNTGLKGGQDVFHVHAHVLGGRQMTWPPG